MRSRIPATSSGVRNFSTGDRTAPPASATIHTSPAAPRPFASSTSLSSSLRENEPAPGAASALITPPPAVTDANALKPVCANTGARSTSSIP